MLGEILMSFLARSSAGSFVRLKSEECGIFFVCLIIALINSFLECPQTLHHMLPTPSRSLFPLESISHIPLPLTILSKESHSCICVFGCQTELFCFIFCIYFILIISSNKKR